MNSKMALQRILILDDDEDYRKLLLTWLGDEYRDVEIVEYDPRRQGVPGADFDWSAFDVLLLDYELRMDNVTGLDILQSNYDNRRFPATIMLTGAGNEEVAVRAFKSGVTDYLRKQWLSKEQVRTAVAGAFASLVAKREYLYTQEEVRQAAQIESKKAFDDLRTEFDKKRKLEKKQLEIEWQKFEQELGKHHKLLASIERARQKSEQGKQALITEIRKLKARQQTTTEDARIKKQLETTQQRLERTHNGINDIEQKIERAKASVVKAEWKQGQVNAFQQQIDDDLSSFVQEFEQQEKQMSDTHAIVEEKTRTSMEMTRKTTAEMKEMDQRLLDEVSSQVDKKK